MDGIKDGILPESELSLRKWSLDFLNYPISVFGSSTCVDRPLFAVFDRPYSPSFCHKNLHFPSAHLIEHVIGDC